MLRMAVLASTALALLLPLPAQAQWWPWQHLRTTGGDVWLSGVTPELWDLDGITEADRYELWRVDRDYTPIDLLYVLALGSSTVENIHIGTFNEGRPLWLALFDSDGRWVSNGSATGAGEVLWRSTPEIPRHDYIYRKAIVTYTLNGAAPSTVTPEPASMALLGTGLMGLGAARRRRRREGAG